MRVCKRERERVSMCQREREKELLNEADDRKRENERNIYIYIERET
jgi:hypothetical protein